MKVSIQHKEKTQGLLRRSTLHGIEVHVTFSEEERSIINARGLKYDSVFERGFSADVPPTKAEKQANRSLGRALLNAAVNGKDANTTNLTINKLMQGPDVFYLTTPLEAKEYEAALTDRLVGLKDYIMANEGVEEKSSSFEL